MQRYSSYKDSGVKWLGEIPSHWETRTLKYCCSLKGRIGWNGLRSEEFQYSSYAYLVTGQDFIGSEIDWSKCYQISQERYDEDPYIQLNNGDMLITKDGTIGKVAKVTNLDKPACLNSGIFVIKQKGTYFNQGFLYWMLCSNVLKEFNIYTQTGATIAHLYQNVFENMPCILPPLSEQNAIASYLDSVTTQIDAAIAQQQKMIDLLNERKQIIINNAVTKGLDPNVKMKDSGVDWIGEIPEGWEVRKLKFICSVNDDVLPESNGDFMIKYIEIGDVDFNKGITGYSEYVFKDAPSRARRITKNGDIIISTVRTYLKAIAKIQEDGYIVSTGFAVLRGININSDFLAYSLMTDLFVSRVIAKSVGVSYPAITATDLINIEIAIPPQNIQEEIVSYLHKNTKDIEASINITSKQITLLQERKQIIINEVVTGKVKVS